MTAINKQNVNIEDLLESIRISEMHHLLGKDDIRLLERLVKTMEFDEFYILDFFDDPLKWLEERDIQYPPWKKTTRLSVLLFSIPSLKIRKEDCERHIEQLYYNQLLTFGRDLLYEQLPTNEVLIAMTTPLGHKLAHVFRKAQNK